MVYIIRRNNVAIWIGFHANPSEALKAYRKEIGSLARHYDITNPDWEHELEYASPVMVG